MDGIQQVCLANAIPSTDPHDPLGKGQVLLEIIFKLENRYGMEEKAQTCLFILLRPQGAGRQRSGKLAFSYNQRKAYSLIFAAQNHSLGDKIFERDLSVLVRADAAHSPV
jgi:hypothetical protein